MVGLESLAQLGHKVRVILGPRRKLDVVHHRSAMADPEIDASQILKEVPLGFSHVELGHELLEVRVVRGDVDPGLGYGVEHAIGMVEAAVLETEHALGYLSHQKVEHEAGGRVVRSVQKLRARQIGRAIFERGQPLRVEGAHGLAQVSVNFWIV